MELISLGRQQHYAALPRLRVRVLSVSPDGVLDDDIDIDARFHRVPRSYQIKGMFFNHLVRAVRSRWSQLESQLLAPPRGGRYLPFSDYPQIDYCRIALAAALALHPELPLAEAARRLGRLDMTTFAESRLGRVATSFLRGPADLLLQMPTLVAAVLNGGFVSAERQGERSVRLEFRDYHGWVDCYTVGTVEGMVQRFGYHPRIEVELLGDTDANYRVEW